MLGATLLPSPFRTLAGQQYLRDVRALHPYIGEAMGFHRSGPGRAQVDDAFGRGFTVTLPDLPDFDEISNLHAASLRFFDLATDFAPHTGLTVHPDSRHTAWYEFANGFTPVSIAIRRDPDRFGSLDLGYTPDGSRAALFFTASGGCWPSPELVSTGTLHDILTQVFQLATDRHHAARARKLTEAAS